MRIVALVTCKIKHVAMTMILAKEISRQDVESIIYLLIVA